MIVKNPTDSELKIQYQGFDYAVPANGEISVPDEVAQFWQGKIHSFIIVSKESKKEVKTPETPIVTAGLASVVDAVILPEVVVTTTTAAKKTVKK